jgi:hypothetical protein
VSLEDIYALVAGLVPEIFKEDSACEEGELDCFDVDVGFVSVPGICADDVGDDKAEDSVEEEEEKDDDDDYNDEFEEENPVHRISNCWECRYQLKPDVDNPLGPPKLRFTIPQSLSGLKMLLC